MGINSEVLEPEGTRSSGDGGSDQGVKGAVSFLFVYKTNASFTHPHRSAKKVAKTLPTPPRESFTMTKGPSTTVSRKPSVGGGGGVTPYEVKPPWPESAPPPPPKDDAGGRSIHGAIQAVAGGLPSAGGEFPIFILR